MDNRFDNYFRQLVQSESEALPSEVQTRINETLKSILVDRRRFFSIRHSIVAAIIIGTIVITLNLFPQAVQAFKTLPGINSIFNLIGDRGMQDAAQKQLTIPVYKIAFDNGISMKITDVIFDGSRVSFSYVQESYERDLGNPSVNVKFDNEVKPHSVSTNGKFLSKNKYMGIIDVIPGDQLPGNTLISLNINRIGNVVGEWDFKIPVNKTTIVNQVLYPNIKIDHRGISLNVNKVILSNSSTVLSLRFIHPVSDSNIKGQYRFEIIDDKGEKINGFSSQAKVERQNGYEIANYKLIIPYLTTSKFLELNTILEQERVVVATLENQLPQKIRNGNNSLIISKVETHSNKIVLSYKLDGKIQNNSDVAIQDYFGNIYSGYIIKKEGTSFAKQFPAISNESGFKIIYVIREEPININELKTIVSLVNRSKP